MNQSYNTPMLSCSILALAVTLPQHVVSFAPPRSSVNFIASSSPYLSTPPCTRPISDARQKHHSNIVCNSSPISLDTIMENPESFPNTSRMLRALSQDKSAGDYKEFLTVLSEEWIRYSNGSEETVNDESSWMSRNVKPSSLNIAAAVGTASGYASMQALDYAQHYDSWGHEYPSESYGEQHFASAAANPSSFYGNTATGGFEQQNHHYGESSPNLLRDLAKSLPPPEDYSTGISATSNYDGYAPYHEEGLHYVADAAAANVPDPSVSIDGSSLPSSVHDTVSDATQTLSSQLSDFSYSQSFGQTDSITKRFSVPQMSKLPTPDSASNANAAVSKVKEFATHSTESINHALAEAREAGSSQLNSLFGSVSHSLEGFSDKVAHVGSSSAESMEKVVGELEKVKIPNFDMSTMPKLDVSKVKLPNVPSMPSVDMSKVKLPSVPSFPGVQSGDIPAESFAVEGSHASPLTHVNFADVSLSDIGKSILGSIEYMGGLLYQFLDWVIKAMVGTNLSQVLGGVQTSISALIENASSSVVNILNGLGNLTLKEILQAFLTLILVVTDLILKVTNAIVYLISGKDAGDWVLQANSAVHTYGDQLLAQAGAAYQDVTHKSLAELADSIGDYSHHVGEELLAVMNSLSSQSGAESIMSGSGGDVSFLSAENLDAIASAVQTALSM